jgi:hypothetical protein
MPPLSPMLAALSLLLLLASLAPLPAPENTCIMTYSRPNYLVVPVPSRLAFKYRLFQFWDQDAGNAGMLPVLFVPGNRGSFEQVRSMGHEAHASLAMYSIDFQEEIVAASGVLLLQQAEFVRDALRAVSVLHVGSNITVVGHSMGGVAAYMSRGLADAAPFSTLLLISSPFAGPVVTADWTMQYAYMFGLVPETDEAGGSDLVVASIAGGQRDRLVPPALTLVPPRLVPLNRTVHALAKQLDRVVGTSADHDAIVWCSQVVKPLVRAVEEVAKHAGATVLQRRQLLARALLGSANDSAVWAARQKVAKGESPLGVPVWVPGSIRRALNTVRASWEHLFGAVFGAACQRLALAASRPASRGEDESAVDAHMTATAVRAGGLEWDFVDSFKQLAQCEYNTLALMGVLVLPSVARNWAVLLYWLAGEGAVNVLLLLLHVLASNTGRFAAATRPGLGGARGLAVSLALTPMACSIAADARTWSGDAMEARLVGLLASCFLGLSVFLLLGALCLPLQGSRTGNRGKFLLAVSVVVLAALPSCVPSGLVAWQLLAPARPSDWLYALPEVRGMAHARGAARPAVGASPHPRSAFARAELAELGCGVAWLACACAFVCQVWAYDGGQDVRVRVESTVHRPAAGRKHQELPRAAPAAADVAWKPEAAAPVTVRAETVTLPDGTQDVLEFFSDVRYSQRDKSELRRLSSGEIVQIDTVMEDAQGVQALPTARELRFGQDDALLERIAMRSVKATLSGPVSDAAWRAGVAAAVQLVGVAAGFQFGANFGLLALGFVGALALAVPLQVPAGERLVARLVPE